MTTDTPRTDAMYEVCTSEYQRMLLSEDLERKLHDAEIRIQAEVSRTEMLNCELASSNAALDQMTEDAVAIKAEVERLTKLTEDCLSVIRVHCPTYYQDAMERFNKTNK